LAEPSQPLTIESVAGSFIILVASCELEPWFLGETNGNTLNKIWAAYRLNNDGP